MLTPAQLDRLTAPGSAATVGGRDAIHARSVALVLAEILAESGHRQYIDAEDKTLIYRLTDTAPVRVPWLDLVDLVSALTVEVVDAALTDEGMAAPARRRLTNLRNLVGPRRDGAVSYLRTAASRVRELLPALSDEEYDVAWSAEQEAKRAARAAQPRPVPAGESDKEQAAELLARWATGLPTGRHLLGDVWAAWSAAVQSSAKLQEMGHGALRIGRTQFYALLTSGYTVVSGGARSRYLVVG